MQINGDGYRCGVQLDSRTELVIAVDIAKRLGLSAQRVNVLASGPGFPKPLGKLGRLMPGAQYCTGIGNRKVHHSRRR